MYTNAIMNTGIYWIGLLTLGRPSLFIVHQAIPSAARTIAVPSLLEQLGCFISLASFVQLFSFECVDSTSVAGSWILGLMHVLMEASRKLVGFAGRAVDVRGASRAGYLAYKISTWTRIGAVS